MSETGTAKALHRLLPALAVAATVVLTPLVAAIGWVRWQPLERVAWALGALPYPPGGLFWLRLANIAPVLLLGPGMLFVVRWRARGSASAWMLLPVASLLAWGAAVAVTPHLPPNAELKAYKPVIYLYPESARTVRVGLDLDGVLTECEPATDPGSTAWTVLARPDGRLLSARDGREYPYIFWEGELAIEPDMSEGFAVARDEIEGFLEDALARQGLNARERADFIEYWLPRMAAHPFVLVRFEHERYEDAAHLQPSPPADTTIRVFMVFRGLERLVPVTVQPLPQAPERDGFVVVEWGGAEVQ